MSSKPKDKSANDKEMSISTWWTLFPQLWMCFSLAGMWLTLWRLGPPGDGGIDDDSKRFHMMLKMFAGGPYTLLVVGGVLIWYGNGRATEKEKLIALQSKMGALVLHGVSKKKWKRHRKDSTNKWYVIYNCFTPWKIIPLRFTHGSREYR